MARAVLETDDPARASRWVWGIGLGARHPDAAVPARWPGANRLGFALMRVRAELAG